MLNISNDHRQRLLNHLSKTVECGTHSGYPACCISFYVIRLLSFSRQQFRNYKKKMVQSQIDWQYIPCPDCLSSGNKVKSKRCPKGSCGMGCHAEECIGLDNEIPRR